ncbi:MAG: hypothetical protein A3G76_05685 [Acidobacteria bacterium RIFCSPLOWO2_12_FULL_65_11]|nr:MAG: hypothetical protein A3G76_05685 [Acidobacteria bacterium RIFCSPLOWO2_12_FULL_65_11]
MTTASFVLEIDRTDPDYGRLVGFAARLKNLLDKPKIQADANLPDALDDFLGAIYALALAKSLGFSERPAGTRTERDKVQIRAEQVSNGRLRLDGKWMAGFHFNSGILRLSAVYHRVLRVITADHQKGHMVADLLPKLSYTWSRVNIAKVHVEVNKLKHDSGGLGKGLDAKFGQALGAVDELLKLVEACPTFR